MDANTFGFNHLVVAVDKSQLSGDIQMPGALSDDSTGKDHKVVIRSSGVKRMVGPRHSSFHEKALMKMLVHINSTNTMPIIF